MQKDSNMLQELKEIAPLVEAAGNHNVYTVPADYFNNLANEVLLKVKQPQLSQAVFKVPDGFFETLSENIMQKIRQSSKKESEIFEEMQQVAPLLNTIDKRNVYAVPAGFFENFTVTLPVVEAKVIQIRNKRSWLKYAVAAVVAAVMVTGGYIWFGKDNSYVEKFRSMAKVDVPKEISTFEDADIIHYLDRQPVTTDIASVSLDEQAPDVKQYIENASSEEIQQYLDDNSEPGENDSSGI